MDKPPVIAKPKLYAKNQNSNTSEIPSDKRPKVLICIPNLGQIIPELVTMLIAWTHDKRFNVSVHMPSGMLPLDNARNHCVKLMLEKDFDYLWFVDDDIVPPYDALEKLIASNKDVITATCFMLKEFNGVMTPCPVTLKYNENKQYNVYFEGQGIEEIDATGGGCILIKRHILEKLDRPYEFMYNPDGTLALVGDFRFCQKVQEIGYKVHADFTTICSHIRNRIDIKGINDLLVHYSNQEQN